MVIVVMGVSGSGKTTVGRALAAALSWPFADADEFHPPANIAKMSAGQPLNDSDRAPWLAAIRAKIEDWLAKNQSAVITCSALKASYRDQLAHGESEIKFVYLHGDRAVLLQRLEQRENHFMKASLLDSQLAALETPKDAVTVDIRETPAELVQEIRQRLRV
jgi:gluconokinase